MAKLEEDRVMERAGGRPVALAGRETVRPVRPEPGLLVAEPRPAAAEGAAVHALTSPAHRSTILLAALQIVLDALVITGAFALAYRLRFEYDILPVKDPPKPEVY